MGKVVSSLEIIPLCTVCILCVCVCVRICACQEELSFPRNLNSVPVCGLQSVSAYTINPSLAEL